MTNSFIPFFVERKVKILYNVYLFDEKVFHFLKLLSNLIFIMNLIFF